MIEGRVFLAIIKRETDDPDHFQFVAPFNDWNFAALTDETIQTVSETLVKFLRDLRTRQQTDVLTEDVPPGWVQ